jgi:hypothetical protein
MIEGKHLQQLNNFSQENFNHGVQHASFNFSSYSGIFQQIQLLQLYLISSVRFSWTFSTTGIILSFAFGLRILKA